MPQQSSPPYLPTATLWPRQLNRWLDINAQNGPLERTQTYITLPNFTYTQAWLGYSNLIAAYNFEGPNNFSLTSFQKVINPNYLLCIMWIDKNGNTHRYSLWNNIGEVMYVPYDLYTGQLIGKNFRFEIWSISNSINQVQTYPINFYTSKLGIQDYRHGVDSVLVNSDSPCTNFYVNANNILTLPTDIGLLFQVDVFHGLLPSSGAITSWTSIVDNTTQLIPSDENIFIVPSGLPAGSKAISMIDSISFLYTQSAPRMGVQLMVLTCEITGAAQSFLFSAYPSGIALFWNNGTITTGGTGPSVTGLSLNTWYVFVYYLSGGNATLSVYNASTGNLIQSNTSLAPIVGYTNAISLGNANCNILEAILAANTPSNSDTQQIASYMKQKYFLGNEFTLPMIFPAGSTPQINNI